MGHKAASGVRNASLAPPITTTPLAPFDLFSAADTDRAPAASQGSVACVIATHTNKRAATEANAEAAANATTDATADATAVAAADAAAHATAYATPAATTHSKANGLRISLTRLLSEWALSLLIAAAVLTALRGVWVAIDVTLLPQEPVTSAGVSVGIGFGLFVVCATAQPVLAAWAHAHPARRVLWLADLLFTYFSFLCSVFLWRGFWILWDYQAGRTPDPAPIDAAAAADAVVTHVATMAVLVLLGRTRSLVAAPMTIASADSSPPIFGAALTPGFEGLVPTHFRRPPRVEEAGEWYNATGLACFLTGPASESSAEVAAKGERGAARGKDKGVVA